MLRFSYGYLKGGTDAEIVADSGAQLNANQQQLVLMNGMIFGELGVLIGLTEKFATVGGKTQRVRPVSSPQNCLAVWLHLLLCCSAICTIILLPLLSVSMRCEFRSRNSKRCLTKSRLSTRIHRQLGLSVTNWLRNFLSSTSNASAHQTTFTYKKRGLNAQERT